MTGGEGGARDVRSYPVHIKEKRGDCYNEESKTRQRFRRATPSSLNLRVDLPSSFSTGWKKGLRIGELSTCLHAKKLGREGWSVPLKKGGGDDIDTRSFGLSWNKKKAVN